MYVLALLEDLFIVIPNARARISKLFSKSSFSQKLWESLNISKTFWRFPGYPYPGKGDFKKSLWDLKVQVLAFWTNSCSFVICLPVLSISSQVAALCHSSWHFGWSACVAPEAVARLCLRADFCALLCASHKQYSKTNTFYIHVLPQLTSMDWKNYASFCLSANF